jgi:hypothetical protein
MSVGSIIQSPEEPHLEAPQARYWIIAPNGRRVAVDRSNTFTYEDGVKRNGDLKTKTHCDARPRVFCAGGQGESIKYPFTTEHYHLTNRYDPLSWRAVEGANYLSNGFEITAHGKAYYDPNDTAQTAAAKAYDRSQSSFSLLACCLQEY